MRAIRKKRLIAGAGLLILGVFAVALWLGSPATVVRKGYDEFQTPASASTHEDWNLPVGFFVKADGTRSNPFSGRVRFSGGATVHGFSADTVIERLNDVRVPGTARLQVIGRRLASSEPLAITFEDGKTHHYDISVKESSKMRSSGSMEFYTNNEVSYYLDVNREYTCSSEGQPTLVFDSTDLGWEPIRLNARGTWSVTGRDVRIVPHNN
jgi:hypothetical protein